MRNGNPASLERITREGNANWRGVGREVPEFSIKNNAGQISAANERDSQPVKTNTMISDRIIGTGRLHCQKWQRREPQYWQSLSVEIGVLNSSARFIP